MYVINVKLQIFQVVLLKLVLIIQQSSTPAPPIPEPDYSMSESDDDAPKRAEDPPGETSGNSNTR